MVDATELGLSQLEGSFGLQVGQASSDLAALCAQTQSDADTLVAAYVEAIDSAHETARETCEQLVDEHRDMVEEATERCIEGMEDTLDQTEADYEEMVDGLHESLDESVDDLEMNLQATLDDDEEPTIEEEAERAADQVQPLWKTILKIVVSVVIAIVVVVIIAVLVVACFFLPGAGWIALGLFLTALIGAVIGAAGSVLSLLASNLIDGRFSSWQTYLKEAAIGAAMGLMSVAGAALGAGAASLALNLGTSVAASAARAAIQIAIDVAIDIATNGVDYLLRTALEGESISGKGLLDATLSPQALLTSVIGAAVGEGLGRAVNGLKTAGKKAGDAVGGAKNGVKAAGKDAAGSAKVTGKTTTQVHDGPRPAPIPTPGKAAGKGADLGGKVKADGKVEADATPTKPKPKAAAGDGPGQTPETPMTPPKSSAAEAKDQFVNEVKGGLGEQVEDVVGGILTDMAVDGLLTGEIDALNSVLTTLEGMQPGQTAAGRLGGQLGSRYFDRLTEGDTTPGADVEGGDALTLPEVGGREDDGATREADGERREGTRNLDSEDAPRGPTREIGFETKAENPDLVLQTVGDATQETQRDTLLSLLPPGLRSQFSGVAITALSDPDFDKLPGSGERQAIVDGGQGTPSVTVRRRAALDVLRDAGVELLAYADATDDTALGLGDNVASEWDSFPVATRVAIYRAKLKVDRRVTQADLDAATEPGQVRSLQDTLADLTRQNARVSALTATEVAKIERGESAAPSWLDAPPAALVGDTSGTDDTGAAREVPTMAPLGDRPGLPSKADFVAASEMRSRLTGKVKPRSAELEAIDAALDEFGRETERKAATVDSELAKLTTLEDTITAWEATGPHRRQPAIDTLKAQIAAERTFIEAERARIGTTIRGIIDGAGLSDTDRPTDKAQKLFDSFMQWGRANWTYRTTGGDVLRTQQRRLRQLPRRLCPHRERGRPQRQGQNLRARTLHHARARQRLHRPQRHQATSSRCATASASRSIATSSPPTTSAPSRASTSTPPPAASARPW